MNRVHRNESLSRGEIDAPSSKKDPGAGSSKLYIYPEPKYLHTYITSNTNSQTVRESPTRQGGSAPDTDPSKKERTTFVLPLREIRPLSLECSPEDDVLSTMIWGDIVHCQYRVQAGVDPENLHTSGMTEIKTEPLTTEGA